MAKQSAGLLMYRRLPVLEVFLVHPGGPFWAKKQQGVWSIPKGEYTSSEEALTAARREFEEETGFAAGESMLPLGTIRQSGGKTVTAWMFEGDADPSALRSNLCSIEWPPRSGKRIDIAEVNEGRWFNLTSAREYILPSQSVFLDRLEQAMA